MLLPVEQPELFSGELVIDRYTYYLSDECLIAPNALFYPDLFELTSSNANNNNNRMRFVNDLVVF